MYGTARLETFELFDLFCQKPVQNPGHHIRAGTRIIAETLYP